MLVKEGLRLHLRAVSNGDDLGNASYISIKNRPTNLAVLHDVELPEPSLVEWITGGVYDMAQSILFRENKHRVKDALHRLCTLD
jgi:hypothetical protein